MLKAIMTDMERRILDKVSHSYLQRHVNNPVIDEDKLLLIISMLDHNGLTQIEMEDFVVTTMLIQIALDTHEGVSNALELDENESVSKSRQLTVLAGIYYSSLYYKILSDTSNLVLIRVLAEGIKEINEHKILYYQEDFEDIEKLMNSILIIESSLLKKLAEYLHDSTFYHFASQFLFVKRLLKERENFLHSGTSHLFSALRKIVFPKSDLQIELTQKQKDELLNICNQFIYSSTKNIQVSVNQAPILTELNNRLANLIQHHPIANTYVEEG